MKQKKLKVLLITLITLFIFNCATPMGMSVSSIPLKNKFITKNLGKATASNTSLSYIGIPVLLGFPVITPSIQTAIDEAVKEKSGDALVNIRWYQTNTNLLFLTLSTVTVMGDVVKLEDEKQEKKANEE